MRLGIDDREEVDTVAPALLEQFIMMGKVDVAFRVGQFVESDFEPGPVGPGLPERRNFEVEPAVEAVAVSGDAPADRHGLGRFRRRVNHADELFADQLFFSLRRIGVQSEREHAKGHVVERQFPFAGRVRDGGCDAERLLFGLHVLVIVIGEKLALQVAQSIGLPGQFKREEDPAAAERPRRRFRGEFDRDPLCRRQPEFRARPDRELFDPDRAVGFGRQVADPDR